MTIGVLWCWLSVGLFVVAEPRRAARVLTLAPGACIAMRCAGAALLVAGALALTRELGTSLGFVLFLLSLAAISSLAVPLFSLRPRAYALTLPAAAISALLLCLG
jgi:hypothetical protein